MPDPSPDPRPFADLRAALAGSTRGRWEATFTRHSNAALHGWFVLARPSYADVLLVVKALETPGHPAGPDAEFVALAHNDLPAVLAALDAAEDRARDLEATLVTCDPAVYIAEHDEAVRQQARAEAAEGRAAAMEAQLRRLEWAQTDSFGTNGRCPACHGCDPSREYLRHLGTPGHAPDCDLAAALADPTPGA